MSADEGAVSVSEDESLQLSSAIIRASSNAVDSQPSSFLLLGMLRRLERRIPPKRVGLGVQVEQVKEQHE